MALHDARLSVLSPGLGVRHLLGGRSSLGSATRDQKAGGRLVEHSQGDRPRRGRGRRRCRISRVSGTTLPRRSRIAAVRRGTSITTGDRDEVFFTRGWSPWIQEGAVTTRAMLGDRATIRLPLPERRPYLLTLRADPASTGNSWPGGAPAERPTAGAVTVCAGSPARRLLLGHDPGRGRKGWIQIGSSSSPTRW